MVWEGCSGKCAILIAMQIFDHDELPCVLIFSLSLKRAPRKTTDSNSRPVYGQSIIISDTSSAATALERCSSSAASIRAKRFCGDEFAVAAMIPSTPNCWPSLSVASSRPSEQTSNWLSSSQSKLTGVQERDLLSTMPSGRLVDKNSRDFLPQRSKRKVGGVPPTQISPVLPTSSRAIKVVATKRPIGIFQLLIEFADDFPNRVIASCQSVKNCQHGKDADRCSQSMPRRIGEKCIKSAFWRARGGDDIATEVFSCNHLVSQARVIKAGAMELQVH